MESNRLKRKVAEGRLSLLSGNYESAEMIDFVGSLGLFDGVWLVMDHGSVSIQSLPDLSRAADLWGLTAIVRVRSIDPQLIGLTMSSGVHGVIAPQVSTKAEAELVVEATKFPPIGTRGASSGRQSYGRSVAEHLRTANDESFVAVMIEDIVGVENLPGILSVPHIDMFFVARYDLAQSLGMEADMGNPELIKTFDGAIRSIVEAGKVAAAVVGERDLDKYLSLGVRCVKVPGWETFIASGARSFVDRVEASRA